MKLETVGILIDIKPLSERDSLARIFTRDYGVMIGVMPVSYTHLEPTRRP